MALQVRNIRKLALAARQILEVNASNTPDVTFKQFPQGACGATAELLGRYLHQALDLTAYYVEAGRTEPKGYASHAWVIVDGIIIDITADQFYRAPVIVTRQSTWHAQWKVEPPRLPICSHLQWTMYPIWTWQALVVGLAACGFPKPTEK